MFSLLQDIVLTEFLVFSHSYFLDVDLTASGPSFLDQFSEETSEAGPSISLKCVASGHPLPQVTWLLDGLPVPDNSRFRTGDYVTRDSVVVSYVNITSVATQDGGLYVSTILFNALFEISLLLQSETYFLFYSYCRPDLDNKVNSLFQEEHVTFSISKVHSVDKEWSNVMLSISIVSTSKILLLISFIQSHVLSIRPYHFILTSECLLGSSQILQWSRDSGKKLLSLPEGNQRLFQAALIAWLDSIPVLGCFCIFECTQFRT